MFFVYLTVYLNKFISQQASAQTGSGKTISFLFPVLCNLKKHETKGFRALILAPTRELVRQVNAFTIKF